ncbi:MAG: hypothetical protein GF313_09240 [Caldithrix sp.]|nr:hypothetical protein [Caldithrix sp.]
MLSFVLIGACTERDRVNIFDPSANMDTLNIRLFPTRTDSIIELQWQSPTYIEFNSTNVYRRVQSEQFSLIASIPKQQDSYQDSNVELDKLHEYYITLQGIDNESPPSAKLRVVPGLKSFWITDAWDYRVVRLSYDLQHNLNQRYSIWRPEALGLALQKNIGLITSPIFGYIELFDIKRGNLLAENVDMDRPFDTVYLPDNEEFWVTDSSGALYAINLIDGDEQVLTQNLNNPTQIIRIPNDDIFILDKGKKALVRINKQGQVQDIYNKLGDKLIVNPKFMSYDPFQEELYLIDQYEEVDQLLRYSFKNERADELHQSTNLDLVRYNPAEQSIWVASNRTNDAVLMQLSYEGQRLSSLNGFSFISDFKINSDNGNVILVDRGQRKVIHMRSNFTVIGETSDIIAPIKVYIQ